MAGEHTTFSSVGCPAARSPAPRASPFEDSKLTLVSALPAHVPPAVGAPRPPVLADCPRPCHRLAPGPNPGCGRG